ncbi:hypothetical protein GCM10010286_15160 [Streptomyces toxytricini]|nr:hypothetical protein GCM10010286_15160 [Streptomyces toxytricini]
MRVETIAHAERTVVPARDLAEGCVELLVAPCPAPGFLPRRMCSLGDLARVQEAPELGRTVRYWLPGTMRWAVLRGSTPYPPARYPLLEADHGDGSRWGPC